MPFAVFETVLGVLERVAAAAIICYSAQFLSVILAMSFIVISIIQRFYIITSMIIRRLDIETKAPLYALLTDISSGLTAVRAFGWQDALLSGGIDLQDFSQKPYYLMMAIQQWLSLVIGLFIALIAIILVWFAVVYSSVTSGVSMGLAMVNLMNFNGSLWFLVIAWTKMETSLGAANQIRTFARDTPNEDKRRQQRCDLPTGWPLRGEIAIDNIASSYKARERAIVQDISLHIKAGQRVGICGGTGSGKTSLLMTILGLLEQSSGSIKIDHLDLQNISLLDIRSRLAILPQDAVQFPGSIRDNLQLDWRYQDNETCSVASDADMRASLDKVGLWPGTLLHKWRTIAALTPTLQV
ncbi:hypothetical protein VHEMI03228 [[Torrubiella] hemipterigena]|uniref:ABC transmembrane type-1 domain-containing protein n=1 Tax=[Torrubiella] hemipterigena TaxID=1531966 RepID=A0A0A1SS19_9HYPO|nr:hypothetical protein VHEMI03228 [[Torrubiella] hemipterigena]